MITIDEFIHKLEQFRTNYPLRFRDMSDHYLSTGVKMYVQKMGDGSEVLVIEPSRCREVRPGVWETR